MNGVLLIDKPAGMTSHDVVARVRRIIGERRVGHTGTLDPFATGLLVILIGRATRLAQFLNGAEKEYEALIRFGYSTETGDVTGTPIDRAIHAKAQSPQSLRKEEIETAVSSLRGEIEQVPPMYSAKKIQGKRLYEFARAGQEVERPPVRVTIREFEMLSSADELLRANDDGSVDLRVRVVCSAGTYIRTLAEDLGQKLGLGSHVAELRRTRAGPFQIDEALTFERLAEVCKLERLDDALVSPYDAVSNLPVIELDTDQARRIMHGLDLELAHGEPQSLTDGDAIRLSLNNELIAVGRFDASQRAVHPAVVLGAE